MTIFYKATKTDGTDFHTGRVLYAVGKRVRPLPFEGERGLCGAGCLHASSVPAETLVGGWWPCRLFEVTGKPFVSEGHKHGFKQLSVVRELDSHLVFGPNGREVAALIDRAGRLTSEEAKALDAAWDAARDVATHAAWAAAWRGSRLAARNVAWHAARSATGNVAWHAARNAASALVVRDLITPEQFDTLYGPWESASTKSA
jgi:hypothetical protein